MSLMKPERLLYSDSESEDLEKRHEINNPDVWSEEDASVIAAETQEESSEGAAEEEFVSSEPETEAVHCPVVYGVQYGCNLSCPDG